MFKKKPTIKNLSPLRSSDRRKIADQIISDYKITVPSNPAEAGPDTPSTTPTLSAIRNALLPDNAQTARFTTTAGPELKQVQGIVYVGAHPDEEERVLWFKVEQGPGSDKRIYPTVYTLWRNADLPPFPERAVKGAVAAVASLDRHTVPLFVGVCEIDVSALGEVQGSKGHAIRGLHWAGDELWAWSSSPRPGRPAPEYLKGWDEDASESGGIEEGVGELDLTGNDEEPASADVDANVDEGQDDAEEPVKEPTTKEVDDAFVNAFVYALYKLKQDNPTAVNHALTLPVSPSILISNLITPYLPIYSAKQAPFYNIKRTSWKNVKKFIKHLDKLQLVKSKDRSGQETYIWDVDFNDHRVERFVPYKLPSRNVQESAGKSSAASSSNKPAAAGEDPSVGQVITVQTLYRPTSKLMPDIFPTLSISDAQNYYKYTDASNLLDQYLQSQDPPLVSRENRRIINLNPYLANKVFTSSSPDDQGALKRGMVNRDELLNRIIGDSSLVQPHYVILKQGQTIADVKPKAGAPPKVLVTIEKRNANKAFTRVSNLEVFGIIPSLLAEELQKKCASSTSVSQATGAPKGVMEVYVQGDQRKILNTALSRRGLRSQWIDIKDKAKSKGK
ncbi:hypothetical protein N7470_009397 [Penicillium chermesinum]|nr:hypothetical protein N7470_009397 [Penicillium chermesinum]